MAEAKKKPTTKKKTGWYCKPNEEMRPIIEQRCKESMREPGQELLWIARQWLQSQGEFDGE